MPMYKEEEEEERGRKRVIHYYIKYLSLSQVGKEEDDARIGGKQSLINHRT